jgi:hypothetical protein
MSTLRRSIAAVLVGGALALSAIAGAAAHHPGVDNPTLPAGGGETGQGHEMPQGPKLIACLKGVDNPSGKTTDEGGWGVFNAIERGGMVHCDGDGEEDDGYLD